MARPQPSNEHSLPFTKAEVPCFRKIRGNDPAEFRTFRRRHAKEAPEVPAKMRLIGKSTRHCDFCQRRLLRSESMSSADIVVVSGREPLYAKQPHSFPKEGINTDSQGEETNDCHQNKHN